MKRAPWVVLTLLMLAAAPAQAAPNPIAAYGFNEGTGTAVTDASGTGNHGTSTSTTRLYVNGAEIRALTAGGPMAISTGPLKLGGNAIWGEWFLGAMDDVRIYNRALRRPRSRATWGRRSAGHDDRMPAETIQRLYGALGRRDGAGAATCYADDAVFEDPAFGRLEDGTVKDMWRMLCERSDDLEVVLIEHGADGDEGWAHWSATYTFTATGRPVVNDIRSRFRFDGELISDQVDTFSLRRWGAQALGPRGTALATVGLLGRAVRKQARGNLERYRLNGPGS